MSAPVPVGPTEIVRGITSTTLAALAALHVAWGRGSAFPFPSRDDLAEAVVGAARVPPPAACNVVAGALLTGAALVADVPRLPGGVRRPGLVVLASVLAGRGLMGATGTTLRVLGWSDSERFRRADRRVYAPLTGALAVGVVVSRFRRPVAR